MIGYSTVTQKGQVTIPADIRKALHLKTNQKVMIVQEADGAKVKAATDFFSLAGSLRSSKPFDSAAMRKSAKKFIGRRYEKHP